MDAPTTALSTPLAAAAGQGHQAVLQALMAAGANLDSQAQNGHTPLHCAASAGHVPCVEELANSGCDLDIQNQNSNTALHVASSKGAPRLSLTQLAPTSSKQRVTQLAAAWRRLIRAAPAASACWC